MKIIYTANLIATDKDRNVLLVKRVPKNGETSSWSLPGGTRKESENIKDTLMREIQEELGSKIKRYRQFKTYKSIYKDKIVISYYFIGIIEQPITLNKKELSKYKWFSITDIPNGLAFNQNRVLNDFIKWLTRTKKINGFKIRIGEKNFYFN